MAFAQLILSALLVVQAPAPIGDWRGTSLCLQGKPVCKDERVVYHVVRAAGGGLTTTMNKLVNGAEEEMAVLACTWDAASATLACPMPPQWAPGVWRFTRAGDTLTGGLWLDGRGQVRKVEVEKR